MPDTPSVADLVARTNALTAALANLTETVMPEVVDRFDGMLAASTGELDGSLDGTSVSLEGSTGPLGAETPPVLGQPSGPTTYPTGPTGDVAVLQRRADRVDAQIERNLASADRTLGQIERRLDSVRRALEQAVAVHDQRERLIQRGPGARSLRGN